MHRRALFAVVGFASVLGAVAYGDSSKKGLPKTDDTQKVLTLLLTRAEDEIPAASSCAGRFGQTGRAHVKDLLAMEIASLSRGRNSVVGACSVKGACSLTISHEYGEDVSSAKVRFVVKDGRADLDSLACVLSP